MGSRRSHARASHRPETFDRQFRTGQDLTSLRASLGPLYEEQDLSNDNLEGYFWPLRRIGAIADRTTDKVVVLAISLDDTFLTDAGITAGATIDAVRGAYGTEDTGSSGQATGMLVYDALGLAFIDQAGGVLEGRVSEVFVFVPGHSHDIFSQ